MYNCKARDVFCELNWQVPFKKISNLPGNGELLPSVSTINHLNLIETKICIAHSKIQFQMYFESFGMM